MPLRRADEDLAEDPDETPDVTHTSSSPRAADAAARMATRAPAAVPGEHMRDRHRDPARYRVLGEHARGGLGRISRAHDEELGRDIAIKEALSRDPMQEVRFLREALITARLEHPNIVPVYEAGYWPDGTPFYAMKLVAGRPLRDLIRASPGVAERLALLHHVIAVADAIAYAHDRHIIHRDLKPSNVIVGDFGETIVIDWGLAKQLTASAGEDELALGSIERQIGRQGTATSLRGASPDLTTAGSVVGTLAYMSPEQARGAPVDERTDVFAIGAMLWELCAATRKLPAEPRLRRRMLRRAGIDRDLAAIIDKAVAADPAARYRHAGALAADLKAFKAGARIAARSYSLIALLAYWMRRHRALTLSVASIVVLAAIGGALHVRDVTLERDRADASSAIADASLDALTLKHAEVLLASDPSLALDALATYHGRDPQRAAQLRAAAVGRGVATLRATPHTDNIFWLEATRDGGVLSLSSDGTITRTAPGGETRVLARDVASSRRFAYSRGRHLLVYLCNPNDLCLLDTAAGAPVVTPALRSMHTIDLALSLRGDRLATLDTAGVLHVFELGDLAHITPRLERAVDHAGGVGFLDDDQIAVGTPSGLDLVQLDGRTESYAHPDTTQWDFDPARHAMVYATAGGDALHLATHPLREVASASLCHGAINSLRFVPGARPLVAYACREGTVGTWDLARGAVTPRLRLDGQANLVEPSAAGDRVLAAGARGGFAMIDLATDFVTQYRGHNFRVMALRVADADPPFLISADTHGTIRTWPVPDRAARVIATAGAPLQSPVITAAGAVIATSTDRALAVVTPGAGLATAAPHRPANLRLELAPDGAQLAAYGSDTVELWTVPGVMPARTFMTAHGSVSSLHFAGDEVLTAGRDGQLVAWSADGAPRVLARLAPAIEDFLLAPATGAALIATIDGALWQLDPKAGAPRAVRGPGPRVTRLAADRDGDAIFIGDAAGDVARLDTRRGGLTPIVHAAGAITRIAVSPDGHTLVVGATDDTLRIATRGAAGLTWQASIVLASDLAFTRDGVLAAISTSDGTIWFFDPRSQRWRCLPAGAADLGRIAIAPDDRHAVVLDREGRVIEIELDAIRKQLVSSLPMTETANHAKTPNLIQ
ncbi:MAG TPA: serine/threonine-protein kinase [Kofleriaceae bacterium]|nr:serine/threonine-protein kinase [Kofleriaceae bacterium]